MAPTGVGGEGGADPFHAGCVRRYALGLGLCGLAVALRVHRIGEPGLWIDEANSVLIAQAALLEIPSRLMPDSSPPLYYVLVHAWIGLFGDSVEALRALSALVGSLLVAACYWAGRALIGREAGLVAALYCAVSPAQVHYAQQVRMYALLPLLALVATALLVRALRDCSTRDHWGWGVATLLALYTHNVALYLLPVHALLILLSGSARRNPGRWAGAALLGALAYAPWLPFLLAQLENADHYAWFAPYWESWGPLGVVSRTFLAWSPGGEYLIHASMRRLSEFWFGVPALAAAALATLGAWRLARARVADPVGGWWPTLYVLVPIALALAVSLTLTPSYVPSRIDQMMFPGYALLVGAGVAVLRSRALRGSVLLAIALVGIGSTLTLRAPSGNLGLIRDADGERTFETSGTEADLALAIAQRWRDGDVVLFSSLTRAPVEYYLHRAGIRGPFVSFPRDTARHLGAQNDARLLADREALAREAAASVAEARGKLGREGRLFVVRGLAPVNAWVSRKALRERFGFGTEETLGSYQQVGVNAVALLTLHPVAGPAP